MKRSEALQAICAGHKVRHTYYSPEEFVYMNLRTGHLFTEDGYDQGTINGEFWTKYQIWEDGWEIVEEEMTPVVSAFVRNDPYAMELRNHYERLPNYQDSIFSCPQYRRSEPKIQRNKPCPCNSGLKYKKCYGK